MSWMSDQQYPYLPPGGGSRRPASDEPPTNVPRQPGEGQPPAYGASTDEPPTYVPTSGRPGMGAPTSIPPGGEATSSQPVIEAPPGSEPTSVQPIAVPPGYAQPGYAGQPGFPPPGYATQGGGDAAPTRSRLGMTIGLVVGVVVVVAICVAGVLLFWGGQPATTGTGAPTTGVRTTAGAPTTGAGNADAERGATVDTPQVVAGLTLATEPQLAQQAKTAESQLRSAVPNATDAAAGTYLDITNPTAPVVVAAVAADNDNPDTMVDTAFLAIRSQGVQVDNIQPVDAGPLGGVAKCGTTTAQGAPAIACAWGDHGSGGQVLLLNRSQADAQRLFLEVRKAVVHRK
jgi:hypothetical protein